MIRGQGDLAAGLANELIPMDETGEQDEAVAGGEMRGVGEEGFGGDVPRSHSLTEIYAQKAQWEIKRLQQSHEGRERLIKLVTWGAFLSVGIFWAVSVVIILCGIELPPAGWAALASTNLPAVALLGMMVRYLFLPSSGVGSRSSS